MRLCLNFALQHLTLCIQAVIECGARGMRAQFELKQQTLAHHNVRANACIRQENDQRTVKTCMCQPASSVSGCF